MVTENDTVKQEKYYTALHKYPNRNLIPQKELMTIQWVKMMIQRIRAAEAVVENGSYHSLHESVKAALLTYLVDIDNVTKKDVLVRRPIPGKDTRSRTIIVLEETFTTVRKAHLATKHGTPKEMEVWLGNNKLLMHKLCLKVFCKLCAYCKVNPKPVDVSVAEANVSTAAPAESVADKTVAKLPIAEVCISDDEEVEKVLTEVANNVDAEKSRVPISSAESFNHVCSVDVLDISKNPDGYYKYLLVYEDKKTNFIQLRPLNDYAEADIAVELIKIFMDLGPPECIVIDRDNIKLFQLILERVEILSNSKVALALQKTENKLINQVAKNIINWIKEADCTNWGTGCYVVQWQMNNCEENGTTPFNRVFGYKYTGYGYKSKFVGTDELGKANSDDEDKDFEVIEENIKDPIENTASNKESYVVTISEDINPGSELIEIKSEKIPTVDYSEEQLQYESDKN